MATLWCITVFVLTYIMTSQATETTDQLESRLANLEARLVLLDIRQDKLTSEDTALGEAMESTMQALNSTVQDHFDNLKMKTQHQTDLVHAQKNQTQTLAGEILALKAQSVQDSKVPAVTFHVRMVSKDRQHPPTGTPLIMTNIRNNHANAYDPHTGKFTVPISGVYCLLASSEASLNHFAGMSLMVDGHSVDYVDTATVWDHMSMSVNAVVSLTAGQQVWLAVRSNSYFWYGPTAFTGFLVHAH